MKKWGSNTENSSINCPKKKKKNLIWVTPGKKQGPMLVAFH
jgi:hypothetical protein